MLNEPTIAPPESFLDALMPLGKMDDAAFELLAAAVTSPRLFTLSTKRIKALQKDLPSLGPNLPVLLSALSYLYSRLEALAQNGGDRDAAVDSLVEANRFPNADAAAIMARRLRRVLVLNEGYTRYRKVRRLQQGFLPNAIGFQSLVDLRPDFGNEDQIEYRGVVPIVQFSVQTDSDDPARKEVVFQLDDEALSELSKSVDRARQKLAALKNSTVFGEEIVELSE